MYRYLVTAMILTGLLITGCGGDKTDRAAEFSRLRPEDVESIEEGPVPEVIAPDLDEMRENVENNPDNPTYRFEYMTALYGNGRVEEALEQAYALAEIKNENPFLGVAYLNIAEMVLDLPRDTPEREEQIREAMDGLWVSLGMEPSSIPMHRLYGELALEVGGNEKAIHHLSIALTVVEIGYKLRTRLAGIYIERDETQKAAAHLDAAYDLAVEADDEQYVRRIHQLRESI